MSEGEGEGDIEIIIPDSEVRDPYSVNNFLRQVEQLESIDGKILSVKRLIAHLISVNLMVPGNGTFVICDHPTIPNTKQGYRLNRNNYLSREREYSSENPFQKVLLANEVIIVDRKGINENSRDKTIASTISDSLSVEEVSKNIVDNIETTYFKN